MSPSARLHLYRLLRPIVGAVAAYRIAFAWRA